MDKAYFKALKSSSDELYAEWEATQDDVRLIKKNIEKEFEVYSLYMSGGTIIGTVVKGHGHEKRGFKSEDIIEDGQKYTVFRPNGRFKEGKRFNALRNAYFRAVGKAPSFSSYVVSKLKVTTRICAPHPGGHGHAVYYATAGFAKGHVVLIIPYNGQYPLPARTPNFDRIKKSEFIALTEE